MGVIFFLKCPKISLNFESAKKKKKIEKDVFFERSTSENVAVNCLLRGEYLSSRVNGLIICPKILDITQRAFFNLDSLQRDW